MAERITDIIESLKSSTCILPSSLREYKCDYDDDELCYIPGRFCITIPLRKKGLVFEKCIRVWRDDTIKDSLKKRYEIISNTLSKLRLPYFVNYEYCDSIVRLADGTVLSGIIMDWEADVPLEEYLTDNCVTSYDIYNISQKFYDMCKVLNEYKIAHGDLSTGNILIDRNGNLKLIDYDTLYVPGMEQNFIQTITGTPGYQHSKRTENLIAAADNDFFSQQVIYLSLLTISYKPQLRSWIDKNLIFDEKDFLNDKNFINSRAYKAITDINNDEIKDRLNELRKAVNSPLSKVHSVCDFDNRIIFMASFCGKCGNKFEESNEILFCPKCGTKREILY